MQQARSGWFVIFPFVLLVVSLACSATAAPTATAVPTSTPAPPTLTATATLKPTSTPRPTATPNLAATEQANVRQKLLQSYADKGYIATTDGEFEEIPDFQQEWAQLGYYRWWPVHESQVEYGDMVFQAHFAWETAASTSDLSGCGIVFGLQPSREHYAVFIDKSRILFQLARGGKSYLVGKTSGSGRLSIGEPAEADVAVVVQGNTTHVVVNGEATKYTLSVDQTSAGQIAYSVLSGTNRDFGTRCNITDAYIWTPSK